MKGFSWWYILIGIWIIGMLIEYIRTHDAIVEHTRNLLDHMEEHRFIQYFISILYIFTVSLILVCWPIIEVTELFSRLVGDKN